MKGQWKQLKGRVRKQWGKLTDDDLDQIHGDPVYRSGMAEARRGPGRGKKDSTAVASFLSKHERSWFRLLAVTRRRLVDRWRAWRSGTRRRWDVALPPPGAPPGVYVLVRGTTLPIRRECAGPEYEPVAAPPPPAVTWAKSDFWRQRESTDPFAWREAPLPPASLRTPRRPR